MSQPIDPATTIGLVSLSVGDLRRSLAYYEGGIGLHRLNEEGSRVTLGAGGVPLLRLTELPGARHLRRATGLYHFALRVPSRRDLARVLLHLSESRTPIGGAADHLVSEALYLTDPDGHGIEIYRDRPREAWYDERGTFRMDSLPLDVDGLMAELGAEEGWDGLPASTDMGHIHLQVADVAAAERFYTDGLGFERMASWPSASFVSAGGYHHHIGMNSWAGAGVPAPPEEAARLLSYELRLPAAAALDTLLDRLREGGFGPEPRDDGWAIRDPSHNLLLLRSGAQE